MRRLELEIDSEAFEELATAVEWYAGHSSSAETRFIENVEMGMNKILSSPETWPLYEAGARRFLVKRFPFAIIYWVMPRRIRILAIMHLHREPGYWRQRIS